MIQDQLDKSIEAERTLRGSFHRVSGFLDKNGKMITKLKRDKKELEVQIR